MKRPILTSALVLLACAVFLSHVVPLLLGLSFTPQPGGVLPKIDRSAPHTPAHPTAVDSYTFPHVDWPWRIVERRILESGDIPLWNPHSSLGLPFPAQYQNQIFLPFEWLEAASSPIVWDLLLPVKLFLAGLGAALFLRKFCSSAPAIAAGALYYTYSGFFLWLYTVPAFVNGAVLLPWAFLAFACLSDQRLSAPRRAGSVAVVTALLWLTGQPQMTALALLSLAVLVLYVSLSSRRREPLLLGALGVALGLMIAAPQLLLFAEGLNHGYSLHRPGAYTRADTSALNLAISIWPFLLGQLMTPWLPSLYPNAVNWEAFPLVIGTSGFLLAGFGLLALITHSGKKPPALVVAMTLIFGVAVLIMVSSAVGLHLWRLPLLNRINLPRYGAPALSLCIAALCAWGIENIRTMTHRQLGTIALLLAAVALATTYVVHAGTSTATVAIDPRYMKLSLLIGYMPLAVVASAWLGVAWLALTRRIDGERACWAFVLMSAGELLFFVRYGLALEFEVVRVALLGLVCVAAVFLATQRIWRGSALLVLVCSGFVALLYTAERRLTAPVDAFAAAPPHVKFLQNLASGDGRYSRLLSDPQVLRANTGAAFGLYELASLNPIQVHRTAQVVLGLLSQRELDSRTPNQWPGMNEDPAAPSWDDYLKQRKWYNALAVEYLIDRPKGPLSHGSRRLERVYADEHAAVYRDTSALPRSYAVTAVHVADDLRGALSLMKAGAFDPRTSAIVEASRAELPPELLAGVKGATQPLSISHLGSTRVEIRLGVATPSLAVLSDAYYPGWTATVDGEARKLFAVNGAVRGVYVKPGEKQLVFSYSPPWLRLTLAISLIAVLVSIALLFWRARALAAPRIDDSRK